MKKFITAAAAALVALFLAACNTQAPEPTEPTQTQTQTEQTSTTTTKKTKNPAFEEVKVQEESISKVDITKNNPTKPEATEESEETTPTTPATMPPTQGVTKPGRTIVVTTVKGSLTSTDLDFIYGSETIKLNEKVEDVFKKLGDDSYEKPSKKTNSYEFDDFTLYSYVEEGVERVDKIVVSDNDYSTAKGAKIGMYASRLRREYGDANKMTDSQYVFGSGTKSLIFTYEDNIVTGIIYKLDH
ncbi:MAG: hypothetical protein J1E96_04580 [Ruminococcus sp.]|nr:hypothetical protein [Ruminococcus sp.]